MNQEDMAVVTGDEQGFRLWVFSTLQEIQHLLKDQQTLKDRVDQLERKFWIGSGILTVVALLVRFFHA